MKEQDLASSGLGPEGARARALRDLGNVTRHREDARGVWVPRAIEGVWQDTRYACNAWRRAPLFSLGVIVMLAAGMMLATSVFGFASATFLRGWRVSDAASMVYIRPAQPGMGVSIPELRYLSAHSETTQIAASVRGSARIGGTAGEEGELVSAVYVTGNYFDVLKVGMTTGRGFTVDEDNYGSPKAVAIVSDRLWREHFESDPGLVNRTIRAGRDVFTVVGVARPGFVDPHGSRYEVWMPLTARGLNKPSELAAFADPRQPQPPMMVAGRVRPGVSRAAAQAELAGASSAYRAEAGVATAPLVLIDTQPTLAAGLASPVGQTTAILFSALVLLQVLACANVGNILLARSLSRQREFTIRLSIGASRYRLVRQLVTEAGVLAAVAGVLGLALSAALPRILWRVVNDWPERPEFYAPDLSLFAFGLLMVLGTTAVSGVLPALRATRRSGPLGLLDRHGRNLGGVRLRRLFLGTQIGLATMLLLGASLLTRAIDHATDTTPGFAVRDIQTVAVRFPGGSQGPRRQAFYRRFRDELKSTTLPVVAFSDDPPFTDSHRGTLGRPNDQPRAPMRQFAVRAVSPAYFAVLGQRIVKGRVPLNDDDRDELVLNELAARQLWPAEDPVGKVLLEGFDLKGLVPRKVVGVVADVPVRAPGATEPVIYRGTDYFAPTLLVRGLSPAVTAAMQALASHIDPEIVLTPRPLSDNIRGSLATAIVAGRIAWGIGGLGLLLALIGAFGVFAFAVEERRREIGIRIALGARGRQVVQLVLRSTQRPVTIGLLTGAGVAALAATTLRRFLYGMSPYDPVAYLEVVALLLAAAALATWIPAWRATRVDPAVTLRCD